MIVFGPKISSIEVIQHLMDLVGLKITKHTRNIQEFKSYFELRLKFDQT